MVALCILTIGQTRLASKIKQLQTIDIIDDGFMVYYYTSEDRVLAKQFSQEGVLLVIKRFRQLPPGWYPETGAQVQALLAEWEAADAKSGYRTANKTLKAGVAPHAGWYFSGRLAWRLWRQAAPSAIVVIAGGHLCAGSSIHLQQSDFFEAPDCWLEAASTLMTDFSDNFTVVADERADNTVEVQLPLAAQAVPAAKVLCVRVPADSRAAEVGVFLAEWAQRNDTTLFVAGSADLTHYGPDYNYMPAGTGPGGQTWAAENDHTLSQAMLALDIDAVLLAANRNQATCSAGAINCAMAYAKAIGCSRGELLGRGSSLDQRAASSFVGYAAVGYAVTGD